MNLRSPNTKRFLQRKLVILLLVLVSVAAFATLGDDGKRAKKDASVLLPSTAHSFSLRSNYNYRSNNFFAQQEKKEYIMLNQVMTYQQGNTAYVLPLKKAPLLGKITFNCAPKKF